MLSRKSTPIPSLLVVAVFWPLVTNPGAVSAQSSIKQRSQSLSTGSHSAQPVSETELRKDRELSTLADGDGDGGRAHSKDATDMALLDRMNSNDAPDGQYQDRTLRGDRQDQASPDEARTVDMAEVSTDGSVEILNMGAAVGQMGFYPGERELAPALSENALFSFQSTVCQIRVLNALNRRFPGVNLTAANILPTSDLNPHFAMANVNIRGTAAQLAPVSKGRYAPHRRAFFGVLIGYGPSLHIVSRPTFLDPHALAFSRTMFTAHLDSAWADTPVGLFLHFVIDVLRPGTRNPCP